MPKAGLRIAFISGPSNVPVIYQEWSEKKRQDYFGTNYLKQFLQLASDLDANSYVVTWYDDKRSVVRLGNFLFDNRPLTKNGGARYYIDQFFWHVRLAPKLLRFRPDVLLLTGNQNFWWLFFFMRWFGTKFVISYHSVLWPKYQPKKRSWKILLYLNRLLVLNHAKAIVHTADDIGRQVEELLGDRARHIDILRHFPTWSPEQFSPITAPDLQARPFRVFFISRIETNKGIYDIVDVAQRLEREREGMFHFDVCGSGGELERLRQRIRDLKLEQVITCHGFSNSEKVQKLLSMSHACIVPTRKDYEAGFEMTCAESILSGRPLVTSAVCPALEYLREASIEVEPENVEQYGDAIIALSEDADLYRQKQTACAKLQKQFYDKNNSWYAVMKQAFERHIISGQS